MYINEHWMLKVDIFYIDDLTKNYNYKMYSVLRIYWFFPPPSEDEYL